MQTSMAIRPYIGISGYTSSDEVQSVLSTQTGDDSLPYHVAGFLVSSKSLNYPWIDVPDSTPLRLLPQQRIPEAFSAAANVRNFVYFASTNRDFVFSQLMAMVALYWRDPRLKSAPNLHGF